MQNTVLVISNWTIKSQTLIISFQLIKLNKTVNYQKSNMQTTQTKNVLNFYNTK